VDLDLDVFVYVGANVVAFVFADVVVIADVRARPAST